MHADAIVIASFKISIPPVAAPGDQCFCKYLYIVCAIFSQSFIQQIAYFFFFIPFIKFILLLRGHFLHISNQILEAVVVEFYHNFRRRLPNAGKLFSVTSVQMHQLASQGDWTKVIRVRNIISLHLLLRGIFNS
uniref:Uncharacterized protein n=1 Tax=Meloidogyne incognita TaxID=6306 RepID=A0A914NGP4_MELIC